MSCVACAHPDEQSFTIAVAASLIGLLATAFTLGYTSLEKKHPEAVAHAIRIWAIVAAPPMAAIGYAVATGSLTRTYILDSPLVPVSVLSAVFAPFPFLVSIAFVFPGKGGLFLELLRVTIFVGWLSACALLMFVVAGA